jgi:hypothetical protein
MQQRAREVAKAEDERIAWAWQDQALRHAPRLPEPARKTL